MKTGIIIVWVTFFVICQKSFGQINTYSVNAQIDGVGILYFDIDSNGQDDFYFDIIELSPNVFATRVTNVGFSSYLDNSTFHYPDDLSYGDSVIGYFNTGNAVLGTFTGAGQFSGAGDRYLGIRINDGTFNYDGWILLNCNSSNDTLKIISCGYHTNPGDTILAGQTLVNSVEEYLPKELFIYPNPVAGIINVSDDILNYFNSYEILNSNGEIVLKGNIQKYISLGSLSNGLYIIRFKNKERVIFSRIIITN